VEEGEVVIEDDGSGGETASATCSSAGLWKFTAADVGKVVEVSSHLSATVGDLNSDRVCSHHYPLLALKFEV
jgi:hypothetical protein